MIFNMFSLDPNFKLYLVSCSGALLLWTKATIGNKKIHGLGDVLENLLPNSPRARYLIQFLVFVLLGGYAGIAVVSPVTQAQALAGGMAWSRLAARD